MKYLKQIQKYRFLMSELVKKGIRLKYRRSYLGIIWSLIEPLLTTIVLVVVFGTLFGVKDPTYPLYIISGRLIYTYFANATKGACRSIRSNSGMIKKVYVPKYMYPISLILHNFVIFLISLIVLVIMMVYCRVMPTWQIIKAIPALVILLVMCTGIGMILATLNVFFRDIEYLWNVACLLIMYMSAIFYYPERLMKSGYAWILKFNPLYCIIECFRNAVYSEPWHPHHVMYAAAAACVCLFVGLAFFRKNQDKFILHI